MKILYLTPTVYDEGGVARVLSIKTNHFIEACGHEVYILTSNNETTSFFYDFNRKVNVIDCKTNGFKPFRILDYYKKVKSYLDRIQPDLIVICDFGWKGFCFNLFVKSKAKIVFEIHGSKYNETRKQSFDFLNSLRAYLRVTLLKTFEKRVFLSEHSREEWQLEGEIIPNPVSFRSEVTSNLTQKRVISIARHSYEKGIDRLLQIWSKVVQEKKDWVLDIYGNGHLLDEHLAMADSLDITTSVNFYAPVKNIQDKYLESSIYVMTSRSEGFPMVLLEAQIMGLPIVAYDCPVGPRTIIENGNNGYLCRTEDDFVQKMKTLMEDIELRKRIGSEGNSSVKQFGIEPIMSKWEALFNDLIST
ncbi:glycosyltransferase family 4 protein [Flavobacterium sp. GCM10023249]|uniref:glycosyltransferase family 4 protein n=1 Tax=unclassified Flavobacterium TaxID=196869 RepID=UPI00360A8C72